MKEQLEANKEQRPTDVASGAVLGWSSLPPDSEGFWWLFGDEEFGTMGGNYTGRFPPEMEMRIVEVRKMGSGLYGVAGGRMVSLTPFDAEKRKAGFVGVWQKATPPDQPNEKS